MPEKKETKKRVMKSYTKVQKKVTHRRTSAKQKVTETVDEPKSKLSKVTENELFGKSMILVSLVILVIMFAMVYFLNAESKKENLGSDDSKHSLTNPEPGFTKKGYFERQGLDEDGKPQ